MGNVCRLATRLLVAQLDGLGQGDDGVEKKITLIA